MHVTPAPLAYLFWA